MFCNVFALLQFGTCPDILLHYNTTFSEQQEGHCMQDHAFKMLLSSLSYWIKDLRYLFLQHVTSTHLEHKEHRHLPNREKHNIYNTSWLQFQQHPWLVWHPKNNLCTLGWKTGLVCTIPLSTSSWLSDTCSQNSKMYMMVLHKDNCNF